MYWLCGTDFKAKARKTKTGCVLAVFGLTSNMFVNKHIDLLALGFLTGDDGKCTLGLLSVTPYGVDSRAASIISLRFC